MFAGMGTPDVAMFQFGCDVVSHTIAVLIGLCFEKRTRNAICLVVGIALTPAVLFLIVGALGIWY